MKSIDRLREYAETKCGWGVSPEVARRIKDFADAIEHETCASNDIRRFAERLEAAAAERADVTLFGVDYTALPVDAEGEPIHIGDMMEHGKARGHVIALMLSEYPKKWGGELHWGVQLKGEQAPTALDLTFHHYHAPTVEDVLREFSDELWNSYCIGGTASDSGVRELEAEYAAKLRLVGDE